MMDGITNDTEQWGARIIYIHPASVRHRIGQRRLRYMLAKIGAKGDRRITM